MKEEIKFEFSFKFERKKNGSSVDEIKTDGKLVFGADNMSAFVEAAVNAISDNSDKIAKMFTKEEEEEEKSEWTVGMLAGMFDANMYLIDTVQLPIDKSKEVERIFNSENEARRYMVSDEFYQTMKDVDTWLESDEGLEWISEQPKVEGISKWEVIPRIW